MSGQAEVEVRVPDIGDFDAVDVIEILVKPGDEVNAEDPLITLESDKATMDIPAPQAGRIVSLKVQLGDKIGEGAVIAVIEPAGGAPATPAPATPAPAAPAPAPAPAPRPQPTAAAPVAAPAATPAQHPKPAAPATGGTKQIVVPDIGDFSAVDVIEILVKPGDVVSEETPLVTLESDKATMDIPSPVAGEILSISVKLGDKVSEGTVLAEVRTAAPAAQPAPAAAPATPAPQPAAPAPGPAAAAPVASDAEAPRAAHNYASPAMRKFARELGVDLREVKGTGRKGRIAKDDVAAYVKGALQKRAAASVGPAIPELPAIDFSKYGPIETKPLSKIRRSTGLAMHRSWVSIPHVTQFDEADITELEAFRKSKIEDAQRQGVKLTLVAFLLKAVTVVLNRFPDFNASLGPDGTALVYKNYFHVGVAVNTERGLLVPVVRDVDKKGLFEIAREVRDLSHKARDAKLTPGEMQGGSFTVSSLGGISGTGFTPIINMPEVAILGVSPAAMKPVYREGEFKPRLILPYALSYDHRVIDGVAAAEFTRYLSIVLSDIRHILL
ncbi:MAG: dihydrolipoyllysine-residue acetyltransferase [Gammaproteobacteria bacterium]|nr:dihydrolipoyllysine-residue acetyltransferase [Gammaproteobacteria bacterium]